MPRYVPLALTVMPAMFLFACNDDCKSPFDCKRGQVCDQGLCVPAIISELTCNTDNDCGEAPMVGVRGYICLGGRCQPRNSTAAPIDSGVMADTGMTADGGGGNPDAPAGDGGGNPDAPAGDTGGGGPADSGITESTCTFPTLPSGAMAMAEDTTAPAMFSPTVSNMMPAAGSQLALGFSVAEAGCGLEAVSMTITGDPNGNDPSEVITIPNVRPMGTGSPFTVSVTDTVRNCIAPTPHKVTSVLLRDFAGNTATYDGSVNCATMAGQCYNRRTSADGSPTATDVPVMTFTPTTQGGLQPTLNGVTVQVNANTLSIDIQAMSDVACQIAQITVVASNNNHTVQTTATSLNGISLTVPTCAATGMWTISRIVLRDTAGRTVAYNAAGANYLREGTPPVDSGVTVQRATLQGSGADQQSPNISRILVSAATRMPADPGTSAKVEALGTDDACGLQNGSATFVHASGASFTGALANGAMSVFGCVPIPTCAPRGAYTLNPISVQDLAGSRTTFSFSGGQYMITESDGQISSTPPAGAITVSH